MITYWELDSHNNESAQPNFKNFELPANHSFSHINVHVSGDKFLVAGDKKVIELQMKDSLQFPENPLHESLGRITDIKYSPKGDYIAISSEEQKVILV